MKAIKMCMLVILACLVSISAWSQTLPTSQTAGGLSQQEKFRYKGRNLEERIQTEKDTPEGVKKEDIIPEDSGPMVLVEDIQVEGATLLAPEEIQTTISGHVGTEMSLAAMQKLADMITDIYRAKGYATSRAYLPPQKVIDGQLIIRVIEGKIGKIDIQGNKYFKTSMLRDKIGLEPQGYFDYSALQRSMVYINQSPDRTAKAILAPGATPGTTDVILEIKDSFPLHVGFEYDNYGSRYIGKHRYSAILEYNNVLGFDDKLYAKMQITESDYLKLQQFRYLFPFDSTLDIGAYYVGSKSALGKEFEDADAFGTADIFGIFANKTIIETNALEVRLNAGFDHKHSENDFLGVETSRDDLRVLKLGFDIDQLDPWGRNILTAELDYGVDAFGAMDDKDAHASRAGAGSRFQKGAFNFFRLQELPYETSFLWKNSAQFTNHNLVAGEQFQIGGATSVRGYPPAEYSGDKGYYTAAELSVPFYFIEKDKKVPFREEKLYDSLRMVFFYDFGWVNLKTLSTGEKENQVLRGWGFGTRLNVGSDLTCRVEIGYPAGKTPSDGDHAHSWVEFTWKY